MTAAAPQVDLMPVEVVIRAMLTPSRALDDWLDDLERRGDSANSVREYSRSVGLFVDSLPHDIDVSKITLDAHIRPYLRRYRNRSANTRASYETHLCSFFGWLRLQGKIARDPTEMLVRTRRPAPEDLDVVTVTSDEVRRMLFLAEGWPERLAVNVLAYLGPRRHALSQLRIGDYDRARGRIKFREKGGKPIYKLIPDELDALLEAAVAAGVYETQDYLIPSLRPEQVRLPERNDAVIYKIVRRVARRAGVVTHVHALRAAFACFYLEQNPGDMVGLKELMGHRHLKTTEIYLRKMDRERAMEPVRGLSWGVAAADSGPVSDPRNLRPGLLGSPVDAPVSDANVLLPGGRMVTGRSPNGGGS